MLRERLSREYEHLLNEIGCPVSDHPYYGGRCPYCMVDRYGTWLRNNDPIAFNVGFNETQQERNYEQNQMGMDR